MQILKLENSNMSEVQTNPLIIKRVDGSFALLKSVVVHVDYVNEDGSPRIGKDGAVDSGNYAETIGPDILSSFPPEVIQGLAGIYDAAVASANAESNS